MTDDTTTTDREEAARAATQGEWIADDDWLRVGDRDQTYGCIVGMTADATRDMRHIALNDPATILADIEEGKRLRATIERLGAIGDRMADILSHSAGANGIVREWHDAR